MLTCASRDIEHLMTVDCARQTKLQRKKGEENRKYVYSVAIYNI